MATACLTGLPALISALTFSLNAGLLGDFFSGISFTFCGFFGRLGRLFKVFGCWCASGAGFTHLFARASSDAFAFCCNVAVQARFGRHDLTLPSFERRFGAFAVFGVSRNGTHTGAK